MREQTSTSDVHSSTNALTCLKSELPDKAHEYKEETIIYVSDEMFRPYILLKDINDELYWRPYGGEPIEQIRVFHKWELEAQRKFRDERRSQEEMDELRNLLMSISLVTNFFEFDEIMQMDMVGVLVSKISLQWYCKDKKLPLDIKPEEHEAGLNSYCSLVTAYVTSFYTTMQEIKDSVNQHVSMN